MRRLVLAAATAGCLLLGWGTYYWSSRGTDAAPKAAAKAAAEKPVAVRVTRVSTRSMRNRIELIGSLQANATVEIRASEQGYVTEVPVDLGDAVNAGQVVATLDDSDLREVLARSEAALKVAESQLAAERARAAFAERELDRWERLAGSGVGTPQQLDQAKADHLLAETQADLEAARVRQVAADLERARLGIERTQIRSAITGFVADRQVGVGDLATVNEVLMTIVDLSTVRTVVQIPERDYGKIRNGLAAEVRVDSYPERTFVGSVIRHAPVLSEQTRTAAAEIEIPNADLALKPGMTARVEIVFGRRKQAPAIPVASLIDHEGGKAAYVVFGSPPEASLRPVRTGLSEEGFVEVITGIEVEDRIVTLGNNLLRPGQPIIPLEVP